MISKINELYHSLFSHRKGVIKCPPIMTKDQLPLEVINTIRSCYYLFCEKLDCYYKSQYDKNCLNQKAIEKELWWRFRKQPLEEFEQYNQYNLSFVPIMQDLSVPWNQKLDMLELVIRWSYEYAKQYGDETVKKTILSFIDLLNNEFGRLDYGYRIVNKIIVDITTEEEQQCIEDAIENSQNNVRKHLLSALENYRQRPKPNVSGSIKESISAVEAVCREYTGLTGDNGTLGKALNKLEENGVTLHRALKSAFEQLYTYTNSSTTGIRHSLMDSDGKYVPSKDEAYLMLIQCSAFINYLRMKISKQS